MGYFAGVLLTGPSRRSATLNRSVRLFRAFLTEQRDPDRFYSVLAADSVGQLSEYAELHGAVVLDVGAGPGYFRAAFVEAGARYVSVDHDLGELGARGAVEPGSVVGCATALPFGDGVVDVCYSSNVLEHVRQPWAMADEMLRVTRPGGVVYLSFTVWWSPWGGHETAPWHYFGGERAARRYERRTGRPPKNRYGQSLFPVTVAEAMRWVRSNPRGELVAAFPRYHPRWAAGVTRVPLVREALTWNLAVVMRRR